MLDMRGIKGHGYYTEDYGESGFFIGIHKKVNLKVKLKKLSPLVSNN
jgi:hypothetical protein